MNRYFIDFTSAAGRRAGRGAGVGCAGGAAVLEALLGFARRFLGRFRRGRAAAVATMAEQMEELQGRADRRTGG